MTQKWQTNMYIPYLQAYTNTHTSPDILEKILEDVSKFEGAVMIDIATRADCLENEKIKVLDKISKKIPLTVELGLQSANDETAKIINRGHSFEVFEDAFYRLRKGAPSVKIGIHIINGLPNEDAEMMKNTASRVANLHPDLLKIHLLYVAEGTPLAEMYKRGEFELVKLNSDILIFKRCSRYNDFLTVFNNSESEMTLEFSVRATNLFTKEAASVFNLTGGDAVVFKLKRSGKANYYLRGTKQ